MSDLDRRTTLYLVRHGDTAWSVTRRLAGKTDIPLSDVGERNARQLAARLKDVAFDRVLVSPLIRARRTAELAGFAHRAVVDERLREMNFGRYEGKTVEEIRRDVPHWTYLKDGCPEGETGDDLAIRADALLDDLSKAPGTTLLFAHSVISRVITARYLSQPPGFARNLMLSPGAIGVLGYDAVDDARAIATWNDRSHLLEPAAFA